MVVHRSYEVPQRSIAMRRLDTDHMAVPQSKASRRHVSRSLPVAND